MKQTTNPLQEGIKNVNSIRREQGQAAEAESALKQDQLHIQRKISKSLDLGSNSPIAAATVFLRPDGTMETTAIGIEPIACFRFATELDRLSHVARWHAQRHAHPHQSGTASLAILLPAILMAATYVNTIP